jgi:signal transduction histidine kinase/HAMP domain-containing protein
MIFIAFVAMGFITAAIGGYSLFVLSAARGFVTNTYDGALMAVSYARAASLDFVRAENELLRSRLATTTDQTDPTDRLDQLTKSFSEDLDVAEERSATREEQPVIAEIRALSDRWNRLRQNPAADAERKAVVERMLDRLDMLIELTADSSFIARHRATTAMTTFTSTSIGGIFFALALSAGITFLLGRRIIRPLRAAAAVANRISDGELDTPIPTGSADETGILLRSMNVMQDNIRVMVEREKAQRRSAQNRLVEALETSNEAIILVDASHRIVLANHQLSTFFPTLASRLKPDMAFGEAFDQLSELVTTTTEPDEDGHSEPTGIERELLSAGSEFQLADGRWLRVSCSNTGEGGFFLVISDYTQIKEREAHLKEARQMAEVASEAKSRFLANMSHELRTPLNAIIGFAEVLSGEMFGGLGNPRYLEYAKDIHTSGDHLLTVINNVLDFTKSEAGKLELAAEAVDVAEIVVNCAKIMRDQCTKAELSLSLAMQDEPLAIFGDPVKLRQILLNIMSNAVKFTEPGGAIVVATRSAEDGSVILSVTDTGIGMSPEDIPVAMAPFGQVDSRLARRYEGTGLGLPLTKSLVELHGGTLSIESQCGRGTTVTVMLPSGTQDGLSAFTITEARDL